MTAPTAGLVKVKVFVRFSVVLVRFMRLRTRLPWVFDEITTPVEKQFGPSPMDGKTERAADPLRENAHSIFSEVQITAPPASSYLAMSRAYLVVESKVRCKSLAMTALAEKN